MNIRQVLLSVFVATAAAMTSTHALANPCQNANQTKPNDVYKCLAQSPQWTTLIGQANDSLMGCSTMRMAYSSEIRRAGVRDNDIESKLPTCRVLASVLQEFNGKAPTWSACVDYDGSEQHFRRCMANGILMSSKSQPNNNIAGCASVLQTYGLVVGSVIDSPKAHEAQQRAQKSPITCDQVNNVLQQNNVTMYGKECLGYKPESTAHVRQCIGKDTAIIQSAAGRMDCNKARTIYLQKLTLANARQPADYQIPRCSTLEPVVAEINTQFAQLQNQPAAPAVSPTTQPIQTAAPAQQPVAPVMPAAQRSTAAAANQVELQQRRQQAQPAMQSAPAALPTTASAAETTTAPAAEPEKSNAQKKIEAATQAVEQAKGVLNLFKQK